MKIAGCTIMMAVLLIFPHETSLAARNALLLWGKEVVPSLFPYMVFSRMLARQLTPCVPSVLPVVALGLTGGSPSGSAALSAQIGKNAMDRRILYMLCTLTGTISPMFILHTAGKWLGGEPVSYLLLISHYCAAGISAFLVYRLIPSSPVYSSLEITQDSSEPIMSSIHAVLGVGGCIIFFSVMAEGIHRILPFVPGAVSACCHAMLEVSGGLKAIADTDLSSSFIAIMYSVFLGFSGVSILSQNLMFLKPFGIRFSHLIAFGILRSITSAAITTLLLLLC